MTLLMTMLPVYLIGNVHCFGMCGPLAMMISHSPFRMFYLLGRLLSFTLAGMLAGAVGEVIGVSLHQLGIAALASVGVGLLMVAAGIFLYLDRMIPGGKALDQLLRPLNARMEKLLFMPSPGALFLFGFATILLPCGQTILVYSACALSGSALVGTVNGFAFALLTTPALFLALTAREFMSRWRFAYRPVVAITAIAIGVISILRGLADWGIVAHFGIHPFMVY